MQKGFNARWLLAGCDIRLGERGENRAVLLKKRVNWRLSSSEVSGGVKDHPQARVIHHLVKAITRWELRYSFNLLGCHLYT